MSLHCHRLVITSVETYCFSVRISVNVSPAFRFESNDSMKKLQTVEKKKETVRCNASSFINDSRSHKNWPQIYVCSDHITHHWMNEGELRTWHMVGGRVWRRQPVGGADGRIVATAPDPARLASRAASLTTHP